MVVSDLDYIGVIPFLLRAKWQTLVTQNSRAIPKLGTERSFVSGLFLQVKK